MTTPKTNFSPAPWEEVTRSTNPIDSSVDAVLMKRIGPPSGDMNDERDVTEYSLFFVAEGEQIPDDPPYPEEDLIAFIGESRKRSPFIGFDLGKISITWVGDSFLRVSAEVPPRGFIDQKLDSYRVHLDEKMKRIDIKYDIQRRSLTEK